MLIFFLPVVFRNILTNPQLIRNTRLIAFTIPTGIPTTAVNEALEHFKNVIKICPNREHVLQNKLWNTWMAILRISADLQLQV